MVLDQAGNLRLLLEDPVGSADLFKTFRISPDLKAEELLQLRDEVSYSVSTEALTNIADRRLVLGTVFPVPGQPGHYFIEGNYRYVRPWDVPAMAGPQPMRRYAVEVKGIKAGRAQPITPFPADAYGDVAASAGHYFDANRKGWAVGVYRPVGFDGPNQPVMISLWDGQSWQAASFNERNLLVPPKEQGEKAWSLRPTVVLLDSHILLFEGRYCFMLAVKQKPAGGIGELVWTRGLELDEGNHFCDAVNVGDGAVAVISSDGPAPTFSYLYCGPEGMSKTERLAMRAGPSAKSFVIKATSDGVCHLVWHDSVDKTLKHQTLIRNGGPRQVAPGDG